MDILNKNIYRLAQLIKNNFNIEIIKIEIISDNDESYEVLMSYVYAAPECKNGIIDITKFQPYLNEYLKYAPVTLNPYDLKMMPYFLCYFCVFDSFTPPYDDLSEDHQKIANLTDNLAKWLYENVDVLSRDLCTMK